MSVAYANAALADAKKLHELGEFPVSCEAVSAVEGRQHGPKVGQGDGEAVSQTDEFILLTTEAKWYRNDRMTGKGVPELEDTAKAGDEFLVDFVRVYDIAE